MNYLTVATECPSCGAPLDFTEGTNALKCLHCQSNLFVTGRKQVLSYIVASKLDEKLASALAIKAQRDRGRNEFRSVNAQLYFIPYYRMTGQDLTWEEAEKKVDSDNPVEVDTEISKILLPESREDFRLKPGAALLLSAGELFIKLADKLFYGQEQPEKEHSSADLQTGQLTQKANLPAGPSSYIRIKTVESNPQKTGQYLNGDLSLHDHYVEKNFIACNLQGTALYSLGVRPSVLRLQLFRKEALGSNARAASPALAPKEAEAVALKTVSDAALLTRQVIGRVLSIVYFPFWVVDSDCCGKRSLSIVDAVSKSVVNADAPEALLEILDREMKEVPETAGFRPLVCPNCGWDLPLRPDDCIFSCSNCSKAWQIRGCDLNEVPFTVAEVKEMEQVKERVYLPFWVFKAGDKDGRPFHIFAPAFRYRRLKILMDIALAFTRVQPSYTASDNKNEKLAGCYYDSEDGLLLAGITQSVLTARNIEGFRDACSKELSPSEATLTWFPFKVEGNYLAAPFCVMSIPKNLLL